jgi:iron complex transport system permease protein
MTTSSLSSLTLRSAHFSLRVRRRTLVVAALLGLLVLLLAVVGLATGDFLVPPGDVLAVVFGTADPGTTFIVGTLRAPRVLIAVLVGVAFGASGAIFQSLTSNPLGSPDVIGLSYGTATGGIIAVLFGDGEPATVAAGAVTGGMLTAAAVYLLAYRGGLLPFRLVLVGLGVGYTLLSVNAYLITRASLTDALVAQRWLLGSVNGADWSQVRALGLAVAVLLPCVALISRPLIAMEVGDDASLALGMRLSLLRPLIVLVGVALTAVATAAAGPVGFVALAAPQISRRLTGAAGPGVAVAAITGAVLMLGADLTAQRLLPQDLPVGLVTGLIGGAYLTWLLTSRRRT